MRVIYAVPFAMLASPALAAEKAFFSLANTDFVVSVAFVLFLGILLYYKVPALVAGLLDKRAISIRSDLNEARALREEAQALLASYERKQKEVQTQADRIVEAAKREAATAAQAAKDDIAANITRRLAAAEEQIAAAQAAAIRDVRDQAVLIAVAVAKDTLSSQMTAKSAGALIDDAIGVVAAKMH